MPTQNSSNQKFTNQSDGFMLGGGTTERDLTVTGANITLTGSGSGTYAFPASTDTLVGRISTDTLTNKTLTNPKISQINDANNNIAVQFAANASAVNYSIFSNGATGNAPGLIAAGSDTNVSLAIAPKGTGSLLVYESSGQTTATFQAAGSATNVSANITTQGTGTVQANGVDVVTTTGTQVLTAKTLTTPTITTPVLNGLPTGSGVAVAASPNTLALRDANGNVAMANMLEGYSTTPTASGTTTLTASSNQQQFFTGSLTQIVQMPVASTLSLGYDFVITNNSTTGAVTVNSSGGNTILILAAGTSAVFTCILITGTTAASWSYSYIGTTILSAKKLTVNASLALTGTDGTTMTFPSTSASIARTDNIQTFSGIQTFTSAPVFTALPTGAGVSALGTAVSTLAARDASANLSANNLINGFTTTATSGTAVVLTIASTAIQVFTGATAQTVKLPTTSVVAGGQYTIINKSSAVVTVQASDASTVTTMAAGATLTFTAISATPTASTSWYFPPTAGGSGNMNTTTYDPAAIAQQVVGITATQTLTNKRITPRIGTVTSAATPSINTDTVDQYNITAQAAAITSFTTNLTGTPTDGQRLMIRIKDNGTAQTIAWGATFVSSGTASLLTTTVATKTHLSGFIWDAVAAKWVCIAVDSAGY